MPAIEESWGFRSPDLDDDANSYSKQDSGELELSFQKKAFLMI